MAGPPPSFPIGSRVVLHSLNKQDYNGKTGVVRADPTNERQEIYVEHESKNVSLKIANLKYEEKATSSLSIKEMKIILKEKGIEASEMSGLTKGGLQCMVDNECSSGQEKMRLLYEANARLHNATAANATAGTHPQHQHINAESLRSQADQMASMDPSQLRQQAAMMRSMSPSQIRAMNPMMANMSDAQITQAATQMEMMASNPAMMKMASEQMKNMSQSDVENIQRQMGAGAGAATAATASSVVPSTSTSSTASFTSTSPASSVPTTPFTPEQIQQASDRLSDLDPAQLRQQAQMMRSMSPSQIRAMNPMMANMSDAQIQQATAQMEMMAENPDAMKLAKEQMKNMSPEDMEELQRCQQQMFGGGGSGGGSAGGANAAGGGGGAPSMPTDPSQMDMAQAMSNMDPSQIKKMVGILKRNPSMVKSMMASQPALAGKADTMSEEQIAKMLETFDNMSERQIGMAMGVMGKAKHIMAAAAAMIVMLVLYFVVRWAMGNAATADVGIEGGVGSSNPLLAGIMDTAEEASVGVGTIGEGDEFAETEF